MNKESSTARKINQAKDLLADSVGIILIGYRCMLIGFKSESQKVLFTQMEAGHRVIMNLTLSGSSGNLISFEKMLYSFTSRMTESFSDKDLSSNMYRDIISAYIKNRLYDKDNDNPIAFETLIVQITSIPPDKLSYRVITIDYSGDYKYLNADTSNFAIIGCPGEKQDSIGDALKITKIKEMNLDKLKKFLEELTKEFEGELDYSEFDFDPEKQPAN